MRYQLVVLFLLIINTLLAQDYLITTRGDTLKGSISFQLHGKVEVAIVKGQKRETVSSLGTREVMMRGKRYKPLQFNASVTFMEIRSEGYLTLFAFQPPGTMAYDGLLLQKRDGKIQEVPGIGFKKLMSSYLSDHPELASKIQSGELDRTDLNQIISQYNEFIAKNTETHKIGTAQDTKPNEIAETLGQLRLEIEKSDLPQKQDALDILGDWIEKLKAGKPVLPYMVKSLTLALEPRKDLLDKLNEITKANSK